MSQGKGTALKHSLKLFNHLKSLGVQIFIVSSRREHLRDATVDNLVNVGFYGWNKLILRFEPLFETSLFGLWLRIMLSRGGTKQGSNI